MDLKKLKVDIKELKPIQLSLIIGIFVFILLAAGGGTYYFMNEKKTVDTEEPQLTQEEKEVDNSEETNEQEETKQTQATNNTQKTQSTDATAGWQTYTNRDIGYVVKYPQGWVLTETDRWEEEKHYRYLTISSWENSANRISMHWGFVRDNTYLYSTDRTGIGAGDLVEVPTTMPIFGAPVKKTKLVHENKIKELFYAPRTTPNGYKWEASIAMHAPENYDAVDMTGVSQIDMAEGILANITLMF